MYMSGKNQLGQTDKEKPWYAGALDFVTQGYNVYAQREQQQASQDIDRRKAEASVKIEAMRSGLIPAGFSAYIPRGIQTAIQSDWVMPVAIGAAGLGALYFFLKK